MSNDSQPPAIACNLSAADYRRRLALIAELNSSALRDYRRKGSRIELDYHPSADSQVRELVELEQECCPFLAFTIRSGQDSTTLVIDAPGEAADDADSLFEPYPNRGR